MLYEPKSGTRLGLTYTSPVKLDFGTVPEFTNLAPGLQAALQAAGLLNAKIDLSMKVPQTVMTSVVHDLNDQLDDPGQPRLRVRERKHPKLYWVDPGLVRAVKRQLGPLTSEERGALFEGWVFTLLRTYAEERELYDEIFYWSPPAGSATEVDFLLRRGREFLAVEVKSSARYSSALTSGLRAIADLPKLVRRVLVFTGPRPLVTPDGIEVWPIRRFLDAVSSGKLWP